MAWLALLKLLLSIADQLTSYLHDKQLMDAGEAKAVAASLKGALDATARAVAARNAVSDDPNSVSNDPDNRDNRKS